MAKLKLQPEPTFKLKVAIAIHGGKEESIEFVFKHRSREELLAFMERWHEQRANADTILDMASGWDLTDPFEKASLELLEANYVTAPITIYERYLDEHTRAARKNS